MYREMVVGEMLREGEREREKEREGERERERGEVWLVVVCVRG